MRVRLKHDVLARELAKRNLSQSHWALKLGLSRSFLSMLVNGQRPFPGARTRRKLLEGLALSFDDLFEVVVPRSRLGRALARRLPAIRFTDHPQGDGIMTALSQDLAYAIRTLSRKPSFTVLACLVVALGIGANSAIFSVVDRVLLRPLPYPDPDELVQVFSLGHDESPNSAFKVMSYPDFLDVKDEVEALEDLAAVNYRRFTLTGTGTPERLLGAQVSADFFSLIGTGPALGRAFTSAEDERDAPRVAVASHRLWQRSGGDPAWIGSRLALDGESYLVIGVMPDGFRMPLELVSTLDVDLWIPIAPYASPFGRGIRRFSVYGRLAPGVSLDEAREQLALVGRRLEEAHPKSNGDLGLAASSVHEVVVGDSRPLLGLLAGVVTLLLLLACANVANLLLSRNAGRGREVAIRTALGAGRLRIAAQLLTESVVLGLAGGLLGLLVAFALQRFLAAQLAADLPRLDEVGLDLRVLVFTLVLASVTGAAFGSLPAWLAGRGRFGASLNEAGRHAGAGRGSRRLRAALAVFEISLALVVLTGAGLMLNSLWRLGGVAPGFAVKNRLVAEPFLSSVRYENDAAKADFYRRFVDEAAALPGVGGAGLVTSLPLDGGYSCDTFAVEDRPEDYQPCAEFRVSSPGYFEALGVPFLRGRGFTNADDGAAAPVAVVNETLASRVWPGEDALGKKLRYGERSADGPWYTIVGVVADTRQLGLSREAAPEFHLPLAQSVYVPSSVKLVLQSAVDPASLADSLRERVRALDAEVPLRVIGTMEQVVERSISRPRSRALLLASFASAALLLVMAGIYAVMAYSVGERRHEIGIRVALGARRRDVVRLVLGQGLALTAAGLALGVVGALGLTRVLANLLFEVRPTDPATFVVVSFALCAVALLASYVPARRAAAVEASETLRHE